MPKVYCPPPIKLSQAGRTTFCRDGAHAFCSGFRASKHGIKPECTCPCHKKKKIDIEMDPNL